jgi:hypothetical protein
MANVPVYDKPEVAPGALPALQYSVDTRGVNAGISQAISSVGRIGAAVAQERVQNYIQEKHQALGEGIADAETRLKPGIDNAYHDPTHGLYAKTGKDAVLAQPEVHQHAVEERDNVAATIQDPLARQIFIKRTDTLLEQYRLQGMEYAGQQRRVATEQSAQDAVAATYKAVAANPDSDAFAKTQLDSVAGPLRLKAGSDEHAAALQQEVAGGLAAIRLDTLLARKTPASLEKAAAVLGASRDLLGEKADHYEAVVREQQNQLGGLADAERIFRGAATVSPGGLLKVDRAKLFVDLGTVPAGSRREIATQELNRRNQEAEAAAKQTKAEWFDQAYSAYEAGGKRLSAVPSETLKLLRDEDSAGHIKLMNLVREDSQQSRAGSQPSTDQVGSYTFLINDMATRPETYRDMDEKQFQRDHLDTMGPKLYKQVAERLAIIKKTPEKELSLTGAAEVSVREATAAAFSEKKDDTHSWSDAHQRAWSVVHDYVTAQANQWARANHGKQPALEQYDTWTKERLQPLVVDPGSWSFNKKMTRAEYETSPDVRGKPLVVPKDFAAQVSERLKARGLPPADDATLQRIYRASLGLGEGK